tara:strand:- start:184 stop:984 length:801 start_codon:yes stop_codon:yes gene_type:complete
MEKFLEHQIGFSEYITGNRFIDICHESEAVFCKTDYLHYFQGSSPKVFITHNSDYHIDEDLYHRGPACETWFAQNKDCRSDKVVPIPIGIENMVLRKNKTSYEGSFSSQVKGAHQKGLLLDKINGLCIEKKDLAYLNFNISTFPGLRKFVWDNYSNQDWVTVTENLSMEKFYFDIAQHKFVFSPRGNGVDCHRTWEALYLRTIPIVKKCRHMKEFEDLPIFFVDNWSSPCYNKLNDFYEKVQDKLYDLDKMKISYWRKRINEKLSL